MIEVEWSIKFPEFDVRTTGSFWVDGPADEAAMQAGDKLCEMRHWDWGDLISKYDFQCEVKDPLGDRIKALEKSLAEMVNLCEEYIAGLTLYAYPGWEPHSLDEDIIEQAKALLQKGDE